MQIAPWAFQFIKDVGIYDYEAELAPPGKPKKDWKKGEIIA